MTISATRKSLADSPKRVFTVNHPTRNFTESSPIRNLSASSPKRDFGTIITGWITWGDTHVYPFDYPTGVDSTKTFEELP